LDEGAMFPRESEEFVVWSDGKYKALANTNASCGYVYMFVGRVKK